MSRSIEWLLGVAAREISTGNVGEITAVRESGYDITFDNGLVGTYTWETSDIVVG